MIVDVRSPVSAYLELNGFTIYVEVSDYRKQTVHTLLEEEKKMTDREMEDMLDEIFRKVFKEDW